MHVLWYLGVCYQRGEIPYYSQAAATAETLLTHFQGHAGIFIYVAACWALEASIICSAVMLLAMHGQARLLCYAQIPFRLVCVVPSISLLPIAMGHFDPVGTVWGAFLLCYEH